MLLFKAYPSPRDTSLNYLLIYFVDLGLTVCNSLIAVINQKNLNVRLGRAQKLTVSDRVWASTTTTDVTTSDTSSDDDTTTSDTTVSEYETDISIGLILNSSNAQNGYTLFGGLRFNQTYLIDNCGEVVQSWDSDYSTMSAYLLENGSDYTCELFE